MEKTKVLIVVDYQNDFVTGALGFDSAKDIDEGIASLVKQYAADPNGKVIFTFDTHESNYLETQEGKKLPVPHCIHNEDGWQLYGKVAEAEAMYPTKCTRVKKATFGSSTLISTLQILNNIRGIESITIVGVVTNMCVISNAVIAKAACPEAEIIIKKDLCDSFDKDLHNKALEIMESMQMTVE
jgi:nicotinamidase-related amidase